MDKVSVRPYFDRGLMLRFDIGTHIFKVCPETREIFTDDPESEYILKSESLCEYLQDQTDLIVGRMFSVVKSEFQNGEVNLEEA